MRVDTVTWTHVVCDVFVVAIGQSLQSSRWPTNPCRFGAAA